MNWFKKLFKPETIPVSDSIDSSESKKRIEHLTTLTKRLDGIESASNMQFDMLRVAMDDLDVAIWGKNTHGIFMFLNKSCADNILHTTIAKALNLTDKDFEHDALAPVCIHSDEIVMDTMEPHRFLEHAEYATGQVWIDSTKSPWIRDGVLIGTVGSAKVITDLVPEHIKEKYAAAGCKCIPINVLLSADNFDEVMKQASAETL